MPSAVFPDVDKCSIAIIGLGYVGLPLLSAFAQARKPVEVFGYDNNDSRLQLLRHKMQAGKSGDCLYGINNVILDNEINPCYDHDVYIVAVPTPVDDANRPDLSPLVAATKSIGMHLKCKKRKSTSVIIYESTVYPGATEEVCIPILNGFVPGGLNRDFYIGYSPERISPGKGSTDLTKIRKITSGSTRDAAKFIDSLYKTIITAGTYLAPSIRVAEAAKITENIQRDVNIALINELAQVYSAMNIEISEVIDAASTKWNFNRFEPGLVGGHCIGVDPYYLINKAEMMNIYPELIRKARVVNESMPKWLVGEFIKIFNKTKLSPQFSRVLVFGLTFKENCGDTRNSKSTRVIQELIEFGFRVDAYDPYPCENLQVMENVRIFHELDFPDVYHAAIILVAHDEIKELGYKKVKDLLHDEAIIFDYKAVLKE